MQHKGGYEAERSRSLLQPLCQYWLASKYVDLVSFGGVCSFLPFRNQQLSALISELNSEASEHKQ